jgi:hypothetical protein
MVSTMESMENARELLREADRAEAAPWVDYPPTPAWYPVSVGVWGAAMCLMLGLLENSVWRMLLVFALVGVEASFIVWYRRYRGTWPTGPMPRELRPAAFRFVAVNLLLIICAGALVMLELPWVAAAVVLVLATAHFWWYERAYAAAMAAARVRLG